MGEGSEGSRLEAWMKSHKSEVAITSLLFVHQPTRKQCRLSPDMNTGRTDKQPASAGTLGEKGRCRPSAQVLTMTLDNWSHKTPTQSKRIRTGKKRLKGHGPKNVYNTLCYIYNITLMPKVNTIALGMFCGAKCTHHTFTPNIKHY